MEQGAGFETNTISDGFSVQVVKKSVGQMRFLADVGKHWVRDTLHLTSTPLHRSTQVVNNMCMTSVLHLYSEYKCTCLPGEFGGCLG